MVPWLDARSNTFPPAHTALDEPNGLLAAGGDLSSARLKQAYSSGIFPWYNPGEPILWWSPDPRCVLNPAQTHVSRSLKKHIRRNNLRVTFDAAFLDVLDACSKLREGQEGTWITLAMKSAYLELFKQGHAHSVEVWSDDQLIGGLYGVATGAVFCGESMFSRQPNASKVALAALSHQLLAWGCPLIDCQVSSDHLVSLGAQEIPRDEFLQCIKANANGALTKDWQFDSDILAQVVS